MRESLDFSGLTSKQEWLILYQGWRVGQTYPDGSVWPQPSKRTAKKLIERGLMEERRVPDWRTFPPVLVSEYYVPLHVHATYCLCCGNDESGAAHA